MNYIILLLCLILSGCASSELFEYDKETCKYTPVSKIVNKGLGVKADHTNKTMENSIISIPDIKIDN